VVAFDAPGHGSAAGRHSGLPEFVDAIRALNRSHGPFEALVGHSLGATAGALAARDGLRISRLVLLAPPADPEKYWGRFVRYFRMPARTREAMNARLERRYRTSWAQLKVAGGACRAQVIVFHDRRDGTVPLADGLAIVRSWANARLVRTRGLGHHRILRDPSVIARTVAFVAGRYRIRTAARSRPALRLRPVPAS
jgi:pimeloyl-ACP methyl ester carboxylesterase